MPKDDQEFCACLRKVNHFVDGALHFIDKKLILRGKGTLNALAQHGGEEDNHVGNGRLGKANALKESKLWPQVFLNAAAHDLGIAH